MIAGQADHPEVVGINGHCGNEAIIVKSADDLGHLRLPQDLFLVAQTTFVPKDTRPYSRPFATEASTLKRWIPSVKRRCKTA
jgi:4-hydroxy-3-methylbut-2-enyl diphosphate reductase IspH